MARKVGDRNRDFEQKRAQILDAIEARLLRPDAVRVTMNVLAEEAGVNLSTLRHHLGGRSEVYRAVLARYGQRGAPFLAMVAAPTELDLAASVRWALEMLYIGLQRGVLDMLAMGLAVGMRDEEVGPAALEAIVEPLVQAMEARLQFHVSRGDLPACDTRMASLMLLSPLLIAAMHQHGLGGCVVRPLDMGAMIDEQVRRFVRGWSAAA